MHVTNLFQFLSGYFHQDWYLESANPDDVIAEFLAHEPLDVIKAVLTEIKEILAEKHNDEDLRALIIDDLKSFYDPNENGLSYSAWLKDLESCLEKSIQEDRHAH